MTYKMEIGYRIRELREIQSYTREYLAEVVGISPKFLYEIETGKKGFSADVLYRISKALSVSCDYIMTGEDAKQRGNEKIMCVLESLNPTQTYRIQSMLQVLCDITKSI